MTESEDHKTHKIKAEKGKKIKKKTPHTSDTPK